MPHSPIIALLVPGSAGVSPAHIHDHFNFLLKIRKNNRYFSINLGIPDILAGAPRDELLVSTKTMRH
jgi:hypothetical protein